MVHHQRIDRYVWSSSQFVVGIVQDNYLTTSSPTITYASEGSDKGYLSSSHNNLQKPAYPSSRAWSDLILEGGGIILISLVEFNKGNIYTTPFLDGDISFHLLLPVRHRDFMRYPGAGDI